MPKYLGISKQIVSLIYQFKQRPEPQPGAKKSNGEMKMATITRTVRTAEQAKQLVSKAYEADRQGGLSNEGFTFSGSVLTATTERVNDEFEVKLCSGYYVESSLEEIFNN